ncbi:MAG: hypothetical protein IJU71_00780, partial [Selenomonadaceae bacterium]|nr:hypothetical protein [Selenomonadaceae bacterium]
DRIKKGQAPPTRGARPSFLSVVKNFSASRLKKGSGEPPHAEAGARPLLPSTEIFGRELRQTKERATLFTRGAALLSFPS